MQLCIPSFFKREKNALHFQVGRQGENLATRYLKGKKYRIIDRNVHVGKHDEIDIIAFDPADQTLVFVEVKTRSREESEYLPEMNITWEKRKRMTRAAKRWITEKDFDGGYRIDVVCVAGGNIVDHFLEINCV